MTSPETKSILGVGIIGCGNISSAYLRLAPLFGGIDVRAVADLNREAAKAQAEAFGTTAMSVDDLLASQDIDIVVNLTVPGAHFGVTKRILEAGKHAYSEKPVVLSLEEGETLRTLAKSKALRIGSAPDTFLGGTHQMARALLDDGAVGRITSGTCHVMNHGMEMWHPNPDFFFLPGAGPMLDIGPYYITNLLQLLGPVRRVAALTNMATPTRTIGSQPRAGETLDVKTPTNIHALLEFEQGATITVTTSWDVWAHRHDHMELYGTEGSLFLPDPNFFGGTLEKAGRDGAIQKVEVWDHPFAKPNENLDTSSRANYRAAGLADMALSIREGRQHRCSFDMALHAIDVMVSILESGEIGAFVSTRTSCERPAPLTPDAARALMAV